MLAPMTTRPDVPPPAPTARRRLPTWARVLVGLAVAAVLVPVALTAVFLWGFSGGWDGIRPGAQADDRRVTRARTASSATLDQLTSRTLSVSGGQELARVRTDRCEEGQNNWKIHDGFKLRCERTDVLVLTTGETTLAATAAELDARVRSAGWLPVYDGAGLDEHLSAGRAEGSYRRSADDRQTLSLTVVGEGSTDGLLPTYGDTTVEGDLDVARAALSATGAVRVVVRPTVRYFDD